MGILQKLHYSALPKSQLISYGASLLFGLLILLVSILLYADISPLIKHQNDEIQANTFVINKPVSVLSNLNRKSIHFSENEISQLEKQNFIQDIGPMIPANFQIRAFFSLPSGQGFGTDLFLESIPARFLDHPNDRWEWDVSESFVPIIIPETYLNLYNFGFAESRSLPLLSEGSLKSFRFNLQISGSGQSQVFEAGIVGFSSKINSILAPESFVSWGNERFASGTKASSSRVLVTTKGNGVTEAQNYFDEQGYTLPQDKLSVGKLSGLLHLAFTFLFLIAFTIIVLAISFIAVNVRLTLQKNSPTILNLYLLGYTTAEIQHPYIQTISKVTWVAGALALVFSLFVRLSYSSLLGGDHSLVFWNIMISLLGIGLTLATIAYYRYLLNKTVANIVKH